jgi:hypothetical protein
VADAGLVVEKVERLYDVVYSEADLQGGLEAADERQRRSLLRE